MEVADTIQEIKTICDCGAKATVNARIDGDGHIITQGAQVVLGATTAILPCVTSATSGASGSTGSSGSTDTTESYTKGESSWN